MKSLFFKLQILFLVILLVIGLTGCKQKSDSFSIYGSWECVSNMEQDELDSLKSLYESTHIEIYNQAVGYYQVYTFNEDETYILSWQYVDQNGKTFANPSDGSYNTGDTYNGTYKLENGILSMTRYDDNNQPVFTQEFKLSSLGTESFDMTYTKIGNRVVNDGAVLKLKKTNDIQADTQPDISKQIDLIGSWKYTQSITYRTLNDNGVVTNENEELAKTIVATCILYEFSESGEYTKRYYYQDADGKEVQLGSYTETESGSFTYDDGVLTLDQKDNSRTYRNYCKITVIDENSFDSHAMKTKDKEYDPPFDDRRFVKCN